MSEKLGFFILKSDNLKKDVSGVWPLVDLAATLICSGAGILAVYNSKWGAFTLPMTKRRKWQDAKVDGSGREEDWSDTAIRACTEWLGSTMTEEPEFLLEFAEFQQSDRDEKWKRYRLRAFRVDLAEGRQLPATGISEWLTADELLDERRRPVSPTARHVINELRLKGLV